MHINGGHYLAMGRCTLFSHSDIVPFGHMVGGSAIHKAEVSGLGKETILEGTMVLSENLCSSPLVT